jgi:dipeptidyl aminopeptidase/acylaminoacyl peptidase
MFSMKWLAALAAVVVCAEAALSAPPITAYGRLPTLSGVGLSPDGNTLAYFKGTDTKRFVVIQSLGAKQPAVTIDITGKKVRDLEWADNSHLIIMTSVTAVPRGLEGDREEWSTALVYDVEKHTQIPLLEHNKGLNTSMASMNVIAGTPQARVIDGHTMVYVPGLYFPDVRTRVGLFRVDLETGQSRLISREGRPDVEGWVLDQAGNILAEADFVRATDHWKLVLYRDGLPDKTIMDIHAPIEGPILLGLNEDGTSIVVRMPPSDGSYVYQQVSLKDGSAKPWRPGEVSSDKGVMGDSRTGRVIGIAHTVDRSDYKFFDPRVDTMWRSVNAAFATATNVDLASWSDDKTKVVVRVFGLQIGDGYFLVDMKAKRADPIGSAYDGINEFYEEKWIDYQAADGRKIPAYLTLPKGDAKNLPLVVLPHGGPFARDEPGFDWLSQSIASRGYVVLQPQFRGSDGFGREWLEAGFREYGKKMQTDLSDGVRALAAQGLIDPKRVCIVGASYGGYAALAGATLDTGIYRCAVADAGISDMRDMLKGWPHPTMGATGARFWDRFVGIEDGNLSKLDPISPIHFIDKVTIPILLIHGRDDTVVPFSQSEDMADALKSAKKPYEFVILDHEDHWLSTGATRQQMLEATIKFLEANNPPH